LPQIHAELRGSEPRVEINLSIFTAAGYKNEFLSVTKKYRGIEE
jgi:hypothetical protein